MPARPKTICNHPGCGQLIEAPGFCVAHVKQRRHESDAARQTSAERGYTYQWRKARHRFLSEHPLCAECERKSRITAATVVDHIAPHKGDESLFWSESNWQPLCAPCHSTKTAREDGGFGNALRPF